MEREEVSQVTKAECDAIVEIHVADYRRQMTNRIQECQGHLSHSDEPCGEWFIKAKRQAFCSPTCTAREMQRRKRERA
jgi:hypothetical protein